MHSGVYECDVCWNWRKLDKPAALHWEKVSTEFLSNIDMYDVMNFFPDAGLSREDYTTMIQSARRLLQYSQGMYLANTSPLKRIRNSKNYKMGD